MLYKIIKWLVKDKPMPTMTIDQEIGMFSQLWQNPTFRKYIKVREQYLKDKGIENIINNKLDNTKGLAGQFLEVRELERRAKSAFLIISKRKQNKKQGNGPLKKSG